MEQKQCCKCGEYKGLSADQQRHHWNYAPALLIYRRNDTGDILYTKEKGAKNGK